MTRSFRPRIGVIGQSGPISPALREMAETLGREVARRGGILLSGGRDGVMEAASRGAKEAGGLTVGILPGDLLEEGNEYLDIPITTGLGMDFRSLVLVRSCDAIIMLGGKNGTLLELSNAYYNRKPVVVLPTTGGWAERVPHFAYAGAYLDDRQSVEIRYASTPEEAVTLAFALAQTSRPNSRP